MTGTISDAATPTLHISKSLVSADPLLALFLSWLPPHQVTLIITTDTASSSSSSPLCTLLVRDKTERLHERNAILRALCGKTLLYQMDQYPYCLMGGHAESSVHARSESALVLSAIASFMSMADGIRANETLDNLLCALDEWLQDRSFLVASNCGRPTLADYDVYFALCERNIGNIRNTGNVRNTGNHHPNTHDTGTEQDMSDPWSHTTFHNLHRWSIAVQASITQLSTWSKRRQGGKEHVWGDDLDVLAPSVMDQFTSLFHPSMRPMQDPVPIFDYGETVVREYDHDDPVRDSFVTGHTTHSTGGDVGGNGNHTNTTGGGNDNKNTNTTGGGNDNKNTPNTPMGAGKKDLTDEEKKAVAEKRAKKKEKAAAQKTTSSSLSKDDSPQDNNDELNIMALDIRIGKIVQVWPHESSDKLWCEKIDLGEAEPRQVLSGLRDFYTLEEMEGRLVLVLCNLKQRNLGGVPSHGMVLCASNADHTAVEFVVPPEGVTIGERVMFEGLMGEPEPENKVAKKKILEKLAPDLKTNDCGVVVWNGIPSVTSTGPCMAVQGMRNAQVS